MRSIAMRSACSCWTAALAACQIVGCGDGRDDVLHSPLPRDVAFPARGVEVRPRVGDPLTVFTVSARTTRPTRWLATYQFFLHGPGRSDCTGRVKSAIGFNTDNPSHTVARGRVTYVRYRPTRIGDPEEPTHRPVPWCAGSYSGLVRYSDPRVVPYHRRVIGRFSFAVRP